MPFNNLKEKTQVAGAVLQYERFNDSVISVIYITENLQTIDNWFILTKIIELWSRSKNVRSLVGQERNGGGGHFAENRYRGSMAESI